jgi:Tfp pilus assembly protein PilN
MRELEFLPAWYPALRRKRRWMTLQAWLTGAVLITLGFWMLLAQRNVHAAQSTLDNIHGQLQQTDQELHRLSELQALKQQMSQQAQIVASLGPHVPTVRILNELEQLMPPEMALLDLSLTTQTQSEPTDVLAKAAGAQPTLMRVMHFRLHGVSPTDVDLGNFLARLAGVPYFSDIAMVYSRDRADSGHRMREFEVTFAIHLDDSN